MFNLLLIEVAKHLKDLFRLIHNYRLNIALPYHTRLGKFKLKVFLLLDETNMYRQNKTSNSFGKAVTAFFIEIMRQCIRRTLCSNF